ncbi:MAG: hypothetical protein DI564_11280 [Rhodanobacter denitrificans]|uniref:DUF4124 domain-containing protein n=1 Tax=Rhodanobacter denitrificans TaxID=666685 RepID=A0A2W5KDF4_9GAMM|nr:MAG: hypothetical protein DI564_11280 [Rhodanobacter denitrificans]
MRAALMLAALLLSGASAAEDAAVRRCIGPDGRKVFTDRRCEEAVAGGATDAVPEAAATPVRAGDCADSPEDLRNRLARAWRNGNPIELSGLILWDGHGAQAARAELQSLAVQLREPLLAAELVPFDAESAELTVRAGTQTTWTRTWRLQRTHGCWWLTP